VLDEDGSAAIDGRLTIKGIARPVKVHGTWTLPAADPMGHTRTHMSLQAIVNRRDFDMNWDAPLPSGGSALADDVTLAVELALVAKDHNG
jgi:polyisoprenoid-binding protein YceI